MYEIDKLLKFGGILIIEVPNIKSIDNLLRKNLIRTLQPPYYLYAFSPKSLKKLVEKNNFNIIEQKIYFSCVLGEAILKMMSIIGLKKKSLEISCDKNVSKINNSANNKISRKRSSAEFVKKVIKKIFSGSNMIIVCRK